MRATDRVLHSFKLINNLVAVELTGPEKEKYMAKLAAEAEEARLLAEAEKAEAKKKKQQLAKLSYDERLVQMNHLICFNSPNEFTCLQCRSSR